MTSLRGIEAGSYRFHVQMDCRVASLYNSKYLLQTSLDHIPYFDDLKFSCGSSFESLLHRKSGQHPLT